MTNQDVADEFEAGRECHTTNMYTDGSTVYSYGSHFPIAHKTGYFIDGDQIVLFNSDGYSNTTRRHKGHVLSALRDVKIIYMDTENLKDIIHALKNGYADRALSFNKIYEANEAEVSRLEQKVKRARLDDMKGYYRREINSILTQSNWLVKFKQELPETVEEKYAY